MPEYIEREVAKSYPIRLNHYDKKNGNLDFVLGIESVMEYIGELPAADVVEVKHGEWQYNTDDFTPKMRCSVCGYNKPIVAGEKIKQEPNNFCPNCGADMRKE